MVKHEMIVKFKCAPSEKSNQMDDKISFITWWYHFGFYVTLSVTLSISFLIWYNLSIKFNK